MTMTMTVTEAEAAPRHSPIFRRATIEDVTPLYDLLITMHAENAFFSYNSVKVYERIQDCVLNGYVVVALSDGSEHGEIIGSIGLAPTSHWYSDDRYLEDFWTYVRPDKRNSHVAIKLLKHVIGVAKHLGLPLQIGVLSAKDTEAKNRLFARYMTPVGGIFIWGEPDVHRRRRHQDS